MSYEEQSISPINGTFQELSRHDSPSPAESNTVPIKDTDWIRNSFMLPDSAFEDVYYKQNRYSSSADMKFIDSRPGGAIGINVRPQFTPYADPRRSGRLKRPDLTIENISGSPLGFGAGRYWSENYDDPQQKIYMRFGVPEFNSITNFIRRAFTYEEIVMARRGRAPTWLYNIGSLAGNFAMIKAFPVASMLYMIYKGVSYLFAAPVNKYYSFKPTMHFYWLMVQTIINNIAVNRGMMPKALSNLGFTNTTQVVGKPYKVDSDMMDFFSTMFPEFFTSGEVLGVPFGPYFDVFAIASRGQRVANELFLKEYVYFNEVMDSDVATVDAFKGYLKKRDDFVFNFASKDGMPTIAGKIQKFLTTNYWLADGKLSSAGNEAETNPLLAAGGGKKPVADVLNNEGTSQNAPGSANINSSTAQALNDADPAAQDPNKTADANDQASTELQNSIKTKIAASRTAENQKGNHALSESQILPEEYYGQLAQEGASRSTPSAIGEYIDALDAEFTDGSGFAIFCVDYTGQASESFSNSYGESELSNKLNSLSSTAKEFRFTVQDGNIAGGAIGSVLQGGLNAITDVVGGFAESVTLGMSNLMLGIAGSGYIDIPKHWQNSSASLPRQNYTATLISPYNNVFSHMINIYIPLAMLLAGAVPRSTGRSSYTGPFICQCFDRGRMQVQLGAIESLSITRGTSNLGYSLDGKALAIEVSWSVVDLSSIMHMPIGSGVFFSDAQGMGIDDDSVAANYLAVLAGQDMYSQIYAFPRALTRLARMSYSLGKVGSSYYLASLTHEKLMNGGGLFNITKPFARFYEAMHAAGSVFTGPAAAGNQ